MNEKFIGRITEIEILKGALNSGKSEMISVTGRRRVGKTFLIRKVLSGLIHFELTGIQHTPARLQLANFADKLTEFSKPDLPVKNPENWLDAFKSLRIYLSKKNKRKKIIFFDELPWIATANSGFLEALGYFWNDWAGQNNVLIIICGSAASWMMNHVIQNKGGLHNRLTQKIHLQPFTLRETAMFLQANQVVLNPYQTGQIYMVTGGIPIYLNDIKKGQSVAQNIDRICFASHGLLKDEFNKLYQSLFNKPDRHLAIIRALAGKWKGMTRSELLAVTGIPDGGSMTRILTELEQSDFIITVPALNNTKKDFLFRLIDNYSLFYLKFIQKKQITGEGSFVRLSAMSTWKTWCGYAFENICLTHLSQIKNALGIAAVHTKAGSYYQKGYSGKKGLQVDLLISRADGIINICEIKFYDSPFIIDKRYAEELREKRRLVREASGANKSIHITFITSLGLRQNTYSSELVQSQIVIDKLFT